MAKQVLDESYGRHIRNKFDFFFAESVKPTPLIIYIHGGGFLAGDKENYRIEDRITSLQNGISFASINYPFMNQKPLQEIMRDLARAVQYFKCNAKEYNINKDMIGCYGESAGAGASLFLATAQDLKAEESEDFVLRESSRIYAAGLYDTQSTYDFYKWAELLNITPEEMWEMHKQFNPSEEDLFNFIYGIPIKDIGDFKKPEIIEIREFLDMSAHICHDTPPIYINSGVPECDENEILHTQIFSRDVYNRCKKEGIKTELYTPENKQGHVKSFVEFFIENL